MRYIVMIDIWVRVWLDRDPNNNLYFIGYAGWAILGLFLGIVALAYVAHPFLPGVPNRQLILPFQILHVKARTQVG